MARALFDTMCKRSSMLGVSKDACRALVFEQRESMNLLCCSTHVAGVAYVVAVASVAQAQRHAGDERAPTQNCHLEDWRKTS